MAARNMRVGHAVGKVASVEAQMDLEMILTTGAGIQTEVWGTSGRSQVAFGRPKTGQKAFRTFIFLINGGFH